MFSHIHSVTIEVADQDAALDFYVNTLGWEKGFDNQMSEHMRFLTVVPPGGGSQLVLGHSSWWDNEVTRPGKDGISLIAPDIEATYKTLTERGVRFEGAVEDMPWGSKATWFYDIDNNKFFLVDG